MMYEQMRQLLDNFFFSEKEYALNRIAEFGAYDESVKSYWTGRIDLILQLEDTLNWFEDEA